MEMTSDVNNIKLIYRKMEYTHEASWEAHFRANFSIDFDQALL
jgi:hypothetical protein